MKNILYILIILSNISIAQQQNFKIVQLPLPEGQTYPYAQVEPSIAIDPNDTSVMVAGSVLNDYYYSTDGGQSWESYMLQCEYGVHGDPVLLIDKKSRVYYFHLASYEKTSHLDRIVCQSAKSVDKKFCKGSFPKPNGTKVQDKHWIVENKENGELYMTWTQFDAYNSSKKEDSSIIVFSKSKDYGKSWSDPKRISYYGGDCLDSDDSVEGAVPAVGPNGELYVTWTGPKGLVFQKSLDAGETWMDKERLLFSHPGGWDLKVPGIYRANGLPILKCDLSEGKDRGTLYLNWSDQENGSDDTDVWLSKSVDGGVTWSDKIKVNQDNSGKHQFFTWMTIDQSSGYLYFIYYDRRNHQNDKTDVYMSVSMDGGLTFQDFQVSKTSFLPNDKVFFGDYLNIDVVDGAIRPIWPRMDNNKISLWVALINQKDLLFTK